MRVLHGIENLPDFRNAVVTIGSFDGVHLGHKKILNRLKKIAKEIDGESVVITFHPHPRSVVTPLDKSLVLLSSLREKVLLLQREGIDNLVIVPFSPEFSQMTPRDYIENFLLKLFKPRHLVIGYDHKFGINRSGDVSLIREYSNAQSFSITEIEKEEIAEISISSTNIRKFLQIGNLEEANLFLGHPYLISGTVVSGDKIGNKIGFPTANILIEEPAKLIPAEGVYAVKVFINSDIYYGMMYIGSRPTLVSNGNRSIEVNIFDLNENLYGRLIIIEVLGFVREDIKFDNLDQLRNQLLLDKKLVETKIEELTSSQQNGKNICIAILNYNGEELLEAYLPAVLSSSKYPFNIVVIDNNSNDDSIEYLQEWHPEIRIIRHDKNLGFAGGYNEGLNDINEEFVVLLNSDVRVSKDWLTPIIDLMIADTTIGAVQPKILSIEFPEKFEYAGAAGGWVDRFGYPFCRGRIFDKVEEDHGQYDDTIEVAWVSGAAMVVRNKVFKSLGGFDSLYFAHHEEIDLSYRIRNAGYKCLYYGKSVVYHLGGGTLNYDNPHKIYLNFRNSLMTLLKNEKSNTLIPKFLCRLVLDGLASLLYIKKSNFRGILAIIHAHFSVYKNLPAILNKRREYRRLIEQHKIGDANTSGVWNGLIPFHYYLMGVNKFSKLSIIPNGYRNNEI